MLDKKAYFISAIGTNIGKTIVSAVLAEALEADYWKPIQCGNLSDSDSMFISSHTKSKVFPEQFKLKLAASPHSAAEAESCMINLGDFELPNSHTKLIVEGAGGLLVPINNKNEFVIDIASKLDLPVLLITSCYLGSINHTLLSIDFLKSKNIPLEAIVFTGDLVDSSVEAIKNFTKETPIYFIPKIDPLNSEGIRKAAIDFRNSSLK